MPGYLLVQSDARLIPLPDRSVHCVVTSPPYFGLRDYGTAAWEGGDDPVCDHKMTGQGSACGDGGIARGWELNYRSQCRKCGAQRIDRQIGLEASPDAFVATMVRVFREVKRVLRNDGTCFINMGDSFGLGKQLQMMPHRVALALQADGWIVRMDMVWSKSNPMPESVTDRPTKSHEYLFLLAKQPRYYFDAEAVREKAQDRPQPTPAMKTINPNDTPWHDNRYAPGPSGYGHNPAGRNMRSVLSLPTESFPGAHFATFPRKLVEPCVKAGSSERGCCPRCGAGWVRMIEKGKLVNPDGIGPTPRFVGSSHIDPSNRTGNTMIARAFFPKTTLAWTPSCSCFPADILLTQIREAWPVPCVVLDPFCGSGTSLVVANALGRHAIGLDLSREYLVHQAQRRLERPHAKPLRPARVEPAMPLFGDIDL